MAPWRSRALPLRLSLAAIAIAAATLPAMAAEASPHVSPAPQLGFNTYVQDLCQSNKVWANDAKGQFDLFKSMGANSVALAFPLYTYSLTSNAIFPKHVCGTTYQTPSAGRLAIAIKIAHSLHLRVFLRPMLDETILGEHGGWRGSIRPSNTRLWFRSYLSALTPYLRVAQLDKVEYFSVATELDSMAAKPNWAALISSAKRLYRGQLIFTINWAETATGKLSWARTTPGMDTYQQAPLPNNATPSQLLTSWNNALSSNDQVPFSLAAASIDEVAILAQDGAYSQPWAWHLPLQTNPFNQSIQANWFSMACSFFQSHSMRGIYFWGVWFADGASAMPKVPTPGKAQEIQPASAAVIKGCYTGK